MGVQIKLHRWFIIQSKMFPKFEEIKNFDLTELKPLRSISLESNSFAKENLMKATESNEEEYGNRFVSRSLKKSIGSFEISFESNFLQQHESAFKNGVKKLIDSLYPNSHVEASFQTQDVFPFDLQEPQQTRVEYLIQSSRLLHPKEKSGQFLFDLKTEINLKDFLCLVVKNCYEEISQELLFIAHEVWEEFTNVQDQELTREQLEEFGIKLVEDKYEKLINVDPLEYLNFSKARPIEIPRKEFVKNFKTFLETYTLTILFCIDGYFENPFSKVEDERQEGYFETSAGNEDPNEPIAIDHFSEAEDCDEDQEDRDDIDEINCINGNKKRKL